MRAAFALVFLLASGCTYSVHEVQVSDFHPYASATSGRMVKGEGEQFVIMGFTDNTNYIDQAYRQIETACPGGYVTGMSTQISTDHGFFSWTNRALIQGLCVQASESKVHGHSKKI